MPGTNIIQAVDNFLHSPEAAHPNPGLIDLLYSQQIETQILASAVGGQPVEDKRNTWTDSKQTWSHIRVPYQANTVPTFYDKELTWRLDQHAARIGITGWNWVNRESYSLGYDFDGIIGHAPGTGISDDALAEVKSKAMSLPYVDVVKSTSGNGLHFHVRFDRTNAPKTANHNEHAALARAVLAKMSADVGFQFGSHLDVCGSVLWIWADEMNKDSFAWVSKAKVPLSADDIPANWKDHLDVVKGTTAKVRVRGISDDEQDPLDDLTSARSRVPLDDVHKAVIEELEQSGYTTLWLQDHYLLQTHTRAVKDLCDKWEVEGHPIKGFFDTLATGTDKGKPNCFLIPSPEGSFQVFRFGKGVAEHPLWKQDDKSWTNCAFNKQPTLPEAALALGGVEDVKGGFVFREAEQARQSVEAIGSSLTLPDDNDYTGRGTMLKKHKDGRLIVEVKKAEGDRGFSDWQEKKGTWVRIFNINTDVADDERDYTQYDSLVRSIKTASNVDAGWFVKTISGEGVWVQHPRENVKNVLKTKALGGPEVDIILGESVLRQWTKVNMPFHPEHPGGRQWNIGAAQLKFLPADTVSPVHPHWDLVFGHCGEDLDSIVKRQKWAKDWGIQTGQEYLVAWLACLIREPFEPLPYLFMYGPQESGKSIFHEAISILTTGGVVKADRALTNQGDFNGELANAVLGVVDEVNIAQRGPAVYNKIKEWTTSQFISIHAKGLQVYQQRNCLHFIQTANEKDACPIFPGDTRITMMHVASLEREIPKYTLLQKLEEEAPHFMATLMGLSLPESNSRLRIPVVDTLGKTTAQATNQDPLQAFLQDGCYLNPGSLVLVKDFVDRFRDGLTDYEKITWTKPKILQNMPKECPMGKGTANKRYFGNITLNPPENRDQPPLFLSDGRLKVRK